ncbi:MAG: M28 family peptidase [Bacteroidota bacterium]
MIRRMFVVTLLFSFSLGFAQKSVKKPIDAGNVDYITKEQLQDYLKFIASDELEGRDTPSRGLNIAAKFIATHLSRWGYKPAGDGGTFFQKIVLHKTKVKSAETYAELNGQKYSFGQDLISSAIAGNVSAPMIYAKNGYILKAKEINPYDGVDVKGKIIVVIDGYPKGVTRGDFKGKVGEGYDTPSNYAKMKGALGIIYIPSTKALASWERDKNYVTGKGTLTVPAFKKIDEPQAVPSITADPKLVDAIFAGEKTGVQSMNNRASADSVSSFALSSTKKMSINVGVNIDTLYTQNVVAVLEGSDKKLKDEYVAFGAHYDHIGIRSEPINGDSINNGADDDGSGTVGLISMAEAFAKGGRAKRSILFVWHMGEEKGLWGSKYFVENPTIPLSNIVTQLNIDMIGRSTVENDSTANDEVTKPNEVFSIGSFMMSTELGKLNESVNASLYNMKLNYKFDDPNDPNRLFYRSDHYNYAKKGIPIVFYFDGIHEDYHRVSDEVEKIDFEKLMKVTKTVYALGWKIANLPKRPVVDKEFSRDVID